MLRLTSRFSRAIRSGALGFLAIGLAPSLTSCQQTVLMRVDGDIPDAIVAELPISVGVFYSADFRSHEYVESSEHRGSWRIASGDSQVRAFSRVMTSLFADFQELSTSSEPTVDLILLPRISSMQFSTPEETGFDFFEAWVEYEVNLNTGDGAELPPWRFTGYGQARRERFGSIESGLSESLIDALRNAGAQLATGFPAHPPVQERITSRWSQ